MSRHQQGQHLADFNPTTHPIIARHFFGIIPACRNTLVTADAVADLRRQRHVRKLHRLGPRALDALLVEIGSERGITTIIERKIERYAGLGAEALELAGGGRFPAPPIHGVRP